MNRRKFIEKSAILSAAVTLPFLSCSDETETTSKYKLGYQLYSIRDEMAKDPIATLKALKEMGYQDFEVYGFDPETKMFYGHKSKDFKQILDDLGVTVTSGHYGFSPCLERSDDETKVLVDKFIEGALALNSKYITWPWVDPTERDMDGFKFIAEQLNKIGEQVNAAGLGFAYHNHGYEFEQHEGGTGYDIIMNETDPELVKLQIDMYWVMHSSKYTPMELINKQPGRFVMWHIKDMDKITRDYTELGNGSIDYTKLMPDPKISGLEYYYIEQGGNFAHNSTQSARDSATYFKEHLQKLI